LDFNEDGTQVITKRNFFEYFNEGMTDYITILIIGEKFKKFFSSKFDFGHSKLYKLAHLLIKNMEDDLNEKDIIKDYINRGTEFMQAVRKKHGKHSVTILSQINRDNFDDSLEFFQTNSIERKEELRDKLISN